MMRVSSPQEAEFVLNGKRVINFSGNNSLGLANHPSLKTAARAGIERYGFGAGASRLISGNMEPHEALETALAAFLDRERALFFPSGYQANTGALPALIGKEGVILSDALNHASLIDGMRLARAEILVYPHNDTAALRRMLGEIPDDREVMVVTEALFSMEGDRAPLAEIAALKRLRPFLLYVDEAHSLGATGPGGRGLTADGEWGKSVDVVLGTLGKAFGAQGAFIAARREVVELLVNRARTFIYTTAPPPLLACAAEAALMEVERGDPLRARLRRNASLLRESIARGLGVPPPGRDHIVPVVLPGAERVMQACTALLAEGIFCQGIRPPTVPAGRCRLRFAVSALHTRIHIERAAEALKRVLNDHSKC
jgi:glycine C-acetyltransferase